MKIRKGFVSNSSSSSFVLFKNYLSKEEIDFIRKWKTYGKSKEYKSRLKEYSKDHEVPLHDVKEEEDYFSPRDYSYYPEGWYVEETYDVFNVSTSMDDFDMENYLRVCGIDLDKVGLKIREGHFDALGLNDVKEDLGNYLKDENFYLGYKGKYYYPSRLYAERVFPNSKNSPLGKNSIKPVRDDGRFRKCISQITNMSLSSQVPVPLGPEGLVLSLALLYRFPEVPDAALYNEEDPQRVTFQWLGRDEDGPYFLSLKTPNPLDEDPVSGLSLYLLSELISPSWKETFSKGISDTHRLGLTLRRGDFKGNLEPWREVSLKDLEDILKGINEVPGDFCEDFPEEE